MKFVKQTGVTVGSILNTTTEVVEVLHDGAKALRKFSQEWENDAVEAIKISKAEKIVELQESYEKLGYEVLTSHIKMNDRGYMELDTQAVLNHHQAKMNS